MDKTDKLVDTVIEAVDERRDKKTKGYDTTATVTRVEGGTVYVHIPGGVDETPASKTISAKKGDTVQVRVGGGRAWLVGNASNPPTDDAKANEALTQADVAWSYADEAKGAAEEAWQYADTAKDAADSAQASANVAQTSASNANEYATRALNGLSAVESVSETLTWITQHGTMTLTSDTELDPTHVYFVLDPNGDYVVGSTHYSLVIDPNVDDISTYYELTIDESLNNYVGTHLALDGEGLWLLPAASGTNKVLIATGAGSTYTTAGTYIIDSTNATVASFRANGATIGEVLNGRSRTEIGTDGMHIYQRANGSDTTIAHLGYGQGAAQSGTANAPYYTLGLRASGEVVGNFSSAEGEQLIASGYASHAEGAGIKTLDEHGSVLSIEYTKATGVASHAEGFGTYATGHQSHAEGLETRANGACSHAEGRETHANGRWSHVSGLHNQADSDYQTVIGKYNSNSSSDAFEIGWGTDSSRKNIFAVDTSGNVNIPSGAVYKINGTALSAADVQAPKLTHTNELNVYGGAQNGNFWFNYRNADTDAQESTAQNTIYCFGNYKAGVTGTTVKAGKFNVNGTDMTDFVKEYGTNSSWYYRKWYSGKAEAWRTYNAGSQTPSQWTTGWYYKDLTIAIPSGIFSTTPNTTIATTNSSDMQFMVFTARATSTTSITVRVVKPNSGAATPVIALYVCNMV